MVKILTLWSPHQLFEYLVHSPNTQNAARKNFVQNKTKLISLLSILDKIEC
jgi:hypothetical protein